MQYVNLVAKDNNNTNNAREGQGERTITSVEFL